MDPLTVTPVPCLTDNYAYLLRCVRTGAVALVDPSEPEPVIAALESAGVSPAMILCTHHHHDHVGGVEGLLARYGENVPVVGHESEGERIPRMSRGVADGEEFRLGNLEVKVMHVPGHTTGAVGYWVADGAAVFTGDTLFVAGCGRLFEGTPAMMLRAMERFAALPEGTAVYPGHEYAEKNLRFAATVEPGNGEVRAKLERVRAKRARGEACVPSAVAEERKTNPFWRVREPGVVAFAKGQGEGSGEAVVVLAAVRRARDGF